MISLRGSGWVNRLAWLLVVVVVTFALAVMAVVPPSAQAAPMPQKGQPPMRQVESTVQVNVSTATGRLMRNWQSFIKQNYRGWDLESGPFQVGKYWYVILSRISYTMPSVPAIVVPSVPLRYGQYCQLYWWDVATCGQPRG